MKKRKIWHRILPFVLTVAMLAGFCPQGISFKDMQLTVPEVKAATTLKNPITIPDDSLKAGQRTTWNCIWFGSYPQSEVTKADGTIYNTLKNKFNWDSNGDGYVGKNKYRRVARKDVEYPANWENNQDYRYFKYEPVKWRVLNVDGEKALLVADKALDLKPYHNTYTDVTWETCSLRSWLNNEFINSAFLANERSAIPSTTVKAESSIRPTTDGNKVDGGKDTTDKIFILSFSEVSGKYGFRSVDDLDSYGDHDEAKKCDMTNFAYAFTSSWAEEKEDCYWWIRNPGDYSYLAVISGENGRVLGYGNGVNASQPAVRPALYLDLSNKKVYSDAGTVCSNGKVKESKKEEGYVEDNDFVNQLDVVNMLEDIEISGGKFSSPEMEILGKKVSLINADADVKLSVGDSVQAVYNKENKTVEVLIGFKKMDDSAVIGPDGNKTAYWSESYRKVKNLYQDATGKKVTTTKLWNDYSKLRGKLKKQNASLGLKASASVAGYLEFSCGSGKPVFSQGGIVTEMKTGADYTFHWNPPFSAVYTRIGVGVDSAGNLELKYNNAKQFVFSGSLAINGTLEGAIGIGSKRGGTYAEGTLTGKMNSKLKFPVASLEDSLEVTGNLTAKINIAVLNYDLTEDNLKHDFGDYQFYPAQSKAKMRSIQKRAQSVIDESEMTLTDRSYLKDAENSIQAYALDGTFEKENCFPNSAPQLLSFTDGKKLLIWNDDNPEKDKKNNVAIYYCVYDGQSWGEPKLLEDAGCLCGSVSAVENNGTVNIVFSRSNGQVYEEDNLDDTLRQMDLYTAEFDGENFSSPNKLKTEEDYMGSGNINSVYEMMYNVGVNEDQLCYAWVENTENSYFLSEGSNSIYRVKDVGGGVVDKESIRYTTDTVSDFVMSKDGRYMAWKETSSDDDIGKIYVSVGLGDVKSISADEEFSNLKIADGKLFATKEDGICYWDLATRKEEGECSLNLSDYEVVKNGDSYIIVYRQVDENGKQTLWMVKGSGSNWGESVQISDDNSYIRSMSISLDEEGNVMAAQNLLDVTKDGVQFDKGTLKVDTLDSYADLICGDYLAYDSDKIVPDRDADFTFSVLNNSQKEMNSFEAVIKDEKGNVLYSGEVSENIAPGEEKECTVTAHLPASIQKTKVTLTVTPSYHEADTTNNSCSTTYGYANIQITNVEQKENNQVAVTMTNTGHEAITGSSIAFYLNSEEDTPIYSGEGSALAVGKTVTKTYTIPENVLEGEAGTASLICVVTPKEEEQETADNTGYLEFSWNKTKPVDPGKPKPDDSKKDDNTDKPKPDDSKKEDTTDKPKPDDSKKDDNTNKPNDISNRQIKVSSIQIAGISKQIAQGKRVTLKAAVYPNTATNKRIIWTSSNPKVATVNANGVVTVKKKTGGKKVTITATTTDGSRVSASWKVTSMKGIVKKVKITGAKTVKAGKSLKLKANVTATKKANKKLQWTSSNTKYATVNAKGVVKTKKTAKRKTIKITAMATDGSGKKATFKIKVK